MKNFFNLLIGLILVINNVDSQSDTLMNASVEALIIKASRIESTINSLPASVSLYKSSELKNIKQQQSLQEYVRKMPGVFTMNANNMAQDLRISIRGFGSRAAFGIRGVKLIVDGVPETTPDGQGQIDNLNLGLIERIEVLQGPSSTLYGNASGGVISISTFNEQVENETSVGLSLGSYGQQQYQLSKSLAKENTSAVIYGSYNTADGYRNQSGFKNLNFDAKLRHVLSDKSVLKFNLNYSSSPQADDPGGINLDAVTTNRTQARDRNVLFKTGEEIYQLKGSVQYEKVLSNTAEITSYAFYTTRDFQGKLPFGFGGIIELSRNYAGHGSTYTTKTTTSSGLNSLQIGYDLAIQRDDRKRFFNEEGELGEKTFDQIESFTNVAFYVLDHYQTDNLTLSGGLRYDINKLAAEDNFLNNGDNSGDINLSSFNPSVGLSYKIGQDNFLYTNYSTSFETPTLSELSNSPKGEGGLNLDLKPQRSRNIEIGIKGSLVKSSKRALNYSLALFNIATKNDLVPYELEDYPDRDFFRNAGETRRTGLESSISYSFADGWNSGASFTFSEFEFVNYNLPSGDFAGNYLPGIPKTLATFNISKSGPKGLLIDLQYNMVGELFANDSNAVTVPGYNLLNLNLGYQFIMDQIMITPHFGINNLTNTEYFDNIRINAFGSRFYEPAPTINYFGGVKVVF